MGSDQVSDVVSNGCGVKAEDQTLSLLCGFDDIRQSGLAQVMYAVLPLSSFRITVGGVPQHPPTAENMHGKLNMRLPQGYFCFVMLAMQCSSTAIIKSSTNSVASHLFMSTTQETQQLESQHLLLPAIWQAKVVCSAA